MGEAALTVPQCKAKAQALPWSSQAPKAYENLEKEQLPCVLASSWGYAPGLVLVDASPVQLFCFRADLICAGFRAGIFFFF